MAKRELCTYFDSGYLSRGLVLHQSLAQLDLDFRLTALCLDDAAVEAVRSRDDPTLVPLALDALEEHDPALLETKPTRSTHEYYFTLGPSLIRYLLDRYATDQVTYLDADMCFYSSPEVLFEESAGAATVIVEHRFPTRLRHLEETGRFNVAWVGFSNDSDGRAALEWWRRQCLDWCFDTVEPHRYADQKYLDEFPRRFERVHVLAHPGADVAPWNVADPPLVWTGHRFTVGGRPLVFFHFQGMRELGPRLIDPNLAEYGNHVTAATRRLYRSYVDALGVHSEQLVSSPRRGEPGPGGPRRALALGIRTLRRQLITRG